MLSNRMHGSRVMMIADNLAEDCHEIRTTHHGIQAPATRTPNSARRHRLA